MKSRLALRAGMFGTLAFTSLFAAAVAEPTPSRVIPVADAPVAISRCSYDTEHGGVVAANVMNRAPRSLLSFNIRFQFFDSEGVIGQTVFNASTGDGLASGDSSFYSSGLGYRPFSDPDSVLRYTTCRIDSATFTRGRTWRYGQHYSEKLLPVAARRAEPESLPAPESGVDQSRQQHPLASAPLTAETGTSWTTNVPNGFPTVGTFVHVRVTLSSPASMTISPTDLQISATLPNGATKTFTPMAQAAPQVLRGGYLAYTNDPSELGPSVTPSEDFGAIGSMTLKPNTPVTTVLTFKVDQGESVSAIHVAPIR